MNIFHVLLILAADSPSNALNQIANQSQTERISTSNSFLGQKRGEGWLESNSSIVNDALQWLGVQSHKPLAYKPIDVAVVGNGPLTDHDRGLINGAKEVYRFNSMPNLNKGEHVGTVFLRRVGYEGDKIWGLGRQRNMCPIITNAKAIVLVVNGQGKPISPHKLAELRKEFSRVDVAEESCKEITINGHIHYSNAFKPEALFSTGFVGLAHVLNNSPSVLKGSKVHVFGMNWKNDSEHSGGHPFELEKQLVRGHPRIIVHETEFNVYKPIDILGKIRWKCEYNRADCRTRACYV